MADRDEAVLWSQDMFDRDTPPRCEGRAGGLAAGLATLWDNHLREGVQADGRTTLTAFHLEWRGGSFRIPDQRAGARKMRQWHLAPGGFADELAALHAAGGGGAELAGKLLALAETASTADEFLARARAMEVGAAAGADDLLGAVATRQQRLQWLGVGAWVVLALALLAASGMVPMELTQLRKALFAGMVLGFLLAAATKAESVVRGAWQRRILAALPHPELLASIQYTVGRVRCREIHRITLALADGTRAKFVLSAEGAAVVMRELKRRCPQAVAAGSGAKAPPAAGN